MQSIYTKNPDITPSGVRAPSKIDYDSLTRSFGDQAMPLGQRLEQLYGIKNQDAMFHYLHAFLEDKKFFTYAPDNDGTIEIVSSRSGNVHQFTGESVGYSMQPDFNNPDQVTDYMEGTLESARMAGELLGSKLYAYSENELQRAIMVYGAELRGIKIENPPEAGKTLQEMRPDLAAQMDKIYAEMKAAEDKRDNPDQNPDADPDKGPASPQPPQADVPSVSA